MQCTDTLFNALTSFLTTRTITNDDFTAERSDWSRQDSEMEQVLEWHMFQTLSLCAGDVIHPVLLGRVWLVRHIYTSDPRGSENQSEI
jgi:hypothetical protein